MPPLVERAFQGRRGLFGNVVIDIAATGGEQDLELLRFGPIGKGPDDRGRQGRLRLRRAGSGQIAQEPEDQDEDEDQPEQARGSISPGAAISPGGKSRDEQDDQDEENDRAQGALRLGSGA